MNYTGDFASDRLTLIESGSIPSFEFIYRDNYELKDTRYNMYGVNYKLWLQQAAALYQEMNTALKDCQAAKIVGHEQVAKGVNRTAFDNGVVLYVNYNEAPVSVGDIRIEAKGFTRVEEGKTVSEAAKSRKRKSISLEKKRTRWGYAFALPFAIGFVLFFLSPLILYFILGFSKLSLTGEGMQLLPVGLDNFRQVLFVQVGYFDSVLKSLGELLLTSPAIVLYSFFVATLLNQKFRGRGLARAIFFLPVIMASGIAAVSNNDSLMKYAIHAVSGEVSLSGNEDKTSMVKGLMELLGTTFSPQLFSFVSELVGKIYTITMSSGVQILIFLAGLQGISPSLYEASSHRRRDGLGKLLENHFADDQSSRAGQQRIHRGGSAGRLDQHRDYGYVSNRFEPKSIRL